jgi:hypothetical protein
MSTIPPPHHLYDNMTFKRYPHIAFLSFSMYIQFRKVQRSNPITLLRIQKSLGMALDTFQTESLTPAQDLAYRSSI